MRFEHERNKENLHVFNIVNKDLELQDKSMKNMKAWEAGG